MSFKSRDGERVGVIGRIGYVTESFRDEEVVPKRVKICDGDYVNLHGSKVSTSAVDEGMVLTSDPIVPMNFGPVTALIATA